jgi:hypothetical protein
MEASYFGTTTPNCIIYCWRLWWKCSPARGRKDDPGFNGDVIKVILSSLLTRHLSSVNEKPKSLQLLLHDTKSWLPLKADWATIGCETPCWRCSWDRPKGLLLHWPSLFTLGSECADNLKFPPLHFRTTKPTSGGSCLLHMIIEIKIGRSLWNWIAGMLKH